MRFLLSARNDAYNNWAFCANLGLVRVLLPCGRRTPYLKPEYIVNLIFFLALLFRRTILNGRARRFDSFPRGAFRFLRPCWHTLHCSSNCDGISFRTQSGEYSTCRLLEQKGPPRIVKR